jgi:hypothetical protein
VEFIGEADKVREPTTAESFELGFGLPTEPVSPEKVSEQLQGIIADMAKHLRRTASIFDLADDILGARNSAQECRNTHGTANAS